MRTFSRLEQENNNFSINCRRDFHTPQVIPASFIQPVFEFSYKMTFGNIGNHRDHRSGGSRSRRKGEIFINTFQGKLSEFAIYNHFLKIGYKLQPPDLSCWERGKWDSFDLLVNGKHISVKSTKYFGHLLLLETKDWDRNGRYKPSNIIYDFILLVRLFPDGERLMRAKKLLFSDDLNTENLKFIIQENWNNDIPGYVISEDLEYIIRNRFILPQNALLNGRTSMDAENYYIQSGDLRPINTLRLD